MFNAMDLRLDACWLEKALCSKMMINVLEACMGSHVPLLRAGETRQTQWCDVAWLGCDEERRLAFAGWS
jgi:hypothetical protein